MILITKYHRKGPTGWPRGRQSRISSISLSSGDEKNVFTTATSVRYQFPSLVHLRSSHLCNFFAIIWLSFQFSLSHTHALTIFLSLSFSITLSFEYMSHTLYFSLYRCLPFSLSIYVSLFLFMSLSFYLWLPFLTIFLSFYLCLSIYVSHYLFSLTISLFTRSISI